MNAGQLGLFALLFALLAPALAWANCTNPTGIEGQVFYNADHKTPQFCDGTTWWAMKNGGGLPSCPAGDTVVMSSSGWNCSSYSDCQAPADCSNVGDVCSDGSLFAGFVAHNNGECAAIYVTNDNQSTAAYWKTTNGADDINPQSLEDGQINHANRIGTLSDFPAFELCESNTYHGKDDWYLPARDELYVLWKNRAAIDANAAGAFSTSSYWGSGQLFGSGGWSQSFDTNGGGSYSNKAVNKYVRCIRRN